MTYSLKLTSTDGLIVVDMTNMNPTFSYDYNNPIIKIPTPKDETLMLTKKNLWSTVTLNLNMNLETVMIDFTENSGFGVNGAPINFATPTTVFEKIIHLAMQPNEKKKKLLVNEEFFGFVEIEGYRISNEAGKKDLVTHHLTLPLVSDEGVEE